MKADTRKIELIMARQTLSQQDLAHKAGAAPKTVSTVYNGHSVRPYTLGVIAAALGVDVTEITLEE